MAGKPFFRYPGSGIYDARTGQLVPGGWEGFIRAGGRHDESNVEIRSQGEDVGLLKDIRKGLGMPPITIGNVARAGIQSTNPGYTAANLAGIGTSIVKTAGRVLTKPTPKLPSLPPLPRLPAGAGRAGGIARTAGRIATGATIGATAYELLTGGDGNFAGVVEGETVERIRCPKGFVAVTMPDGNRACMVKALARSLGLWSAKPKPPISGWDARAIRRAGSARKRVKRLASVVGFTCTTKGRSSNRCAPKGKKC